MATKTPPQLRLSARRTFLHIEEQEEAPLELQRSASEPVFRQSNASSHDAEDNVDRQFQRQSTDVPTRIDDAPDCPCYFDAAGTPLLEEDSPANGSHSSRAVQPYTRFNQEDHMPLQMREFPGAGSTPAEVQKLHEEADQLMARAAELRQQAERAKQAMAMPPPGQFAPAPLARQPQAGGRSSHFELPNSPQSARLTAASEVGGDHASWADIHDDTIESNCKDGRGTEEFTTVIFRNMPNDLLRDDICAIMDNGGLAGLYNFVYLPIDFLQEANLGYIFVNFSSHENAVKGWEMMDGFKSWPLKTQKVCAASWSNPMQGLAIHVDRYQNSPVMHKNVPEKFKPILLETGTRVPFPPATKRMKAPRMKKHKPKAHSA